MSGSSPTSAVSGNGNGQSTRPLRLRRVNHSDEIISGFGRLLKTESMTDVTLSCQSGLNIRAHRVILSTFSPYFKAIFESQPFSEAPWHYPVIVMKDYGYSELKAIIEFIYKGEVSVPRDRLASVLQAAKALEVSGLCDLKCENFGVSGSAASSALNEHNSSPGPPPLTHSFNGNGGYSSSLSALSSMGNTGLNLSSKRNSTPDMETIYGGNGSDPSLSKKLRITLDNDVTSSSLNSLGSSLVSSNFANAAGLTGSGHGLGLGLDSLGGIEGVRSLLQQPPRLPHVFQQIRQQQAAQQQTLQQLALNQQKRTNLSLQALVQQQRALQNTTSMGGGGNGGNGGGHNRLSSSNSQRHLQLQQHQLKQQILQQQLLRNSNNSPANNGKSPSNNYQQQQQQLRGGGGPQGVQFMQFQQRIRQQIQEKQRNRESLHERLAQKPQLLLHKQLAAAKENVHNLDGDKSPKKELEHDDDEVEVIISKENESRDEKDEANGRAIDLADKSKGETQLKGDLNKETGGEEDENEQDGDGDGDGNTEEASANANANANASSKDKGIKKEKSESTTEENGDGNGDDEGTDKNNGNVAADYGDDEDEPQVAVQELMEEEDENEEEEYEIEIDKDVIFQQQQQLRLQQIQKQQQYQQQLQLQLEQEEQEQRLIEYHQSLSANGQLALEGSADADASNASNDENENDNGTGFGFDWQEGFTDELPYTAQNATLNETVTQRQAHNGGGNNNPNHHVVQTPDFLQPRGPGRPRKGNKAQEISPCPECNKVFVRPDVLKLHYRSVHLNERHPCNLCPKIFKWPGDLSKHKRTKHPDKYPPPQATQALAYPKVA